MKIKGYLLSGDNIEWIESPNHGKIFETGKPDSIIIHYTAGGSAKSSVNTLCDPDHQASAHLVISKTADVFQLVEFNKIAWHAGKSSYGNRKGYNKFSIGIEKIDTYTKGTVATSLLNIRKGPGVSFETAANPLTQGAEVEILDSDQNWLKVRTYTQGWVSSKYINTSEID